MQELRRGKGPGVSPAARYYITDPGRQGVFDYDAADRNSVDDSVMVLVTSGGARYRREGGQEALDVRWFGARGDGRSDDWYAIQKGIDYILNHELAARTLYFPAGSYLITRPLIIARLSGRVYRQASISLAGPAPSRTIATGYALIQPTFNNSFAIGVQMGKGVQIKDLMLTGKFVFPDRLNEVQVDTLAFSQWTDGSARDNRLSPYAGIVIDPFSDSTVYTNGADMYPGLHGYYVPGISRAGSTSVEITGCSIRNFIVGVMITPSNQQNGELIDVIDCDISASKVAYAMGQAQSKECHVYRLKCWQPVHTVFDNSDYGFRHGDGSAIPMVDGVNIAGYVKELCSIYAASFNGSFRNVYAEGLFRLGYVGGPATVSFEDCQIDFSTQDSGLPYPDYLILGSGATFHNCLLRFYPGVPGARLLLSGTNNHYEGGVMNSPPVAVNLDGNPLNPNPSFENVVMYYSGGILGNSSRGTMDAAAAMNSNNDPVYYGNTYGYRETSYGADLQYRISYNDNYERTVRLSGTPLLHTDKRKWTAYFKLGAAADAGVLQPGDFILTSGHHYQDQLASATAATYPVGIVARIGHDTVYLTNLAVGIADNTGMSLWADYYVNEHAPMTGDLASGSNTLVHVQGRFPVVGERLDIPVLPSGSFVTAVDQKAKTVSFSNSNSSGSALKDYTFMNGYPTVTLYSAFELPVLQQSRKTLIGSADFYLYDVRDINTRDRDFPVNGAHFDRYRILNTNIYGDTSLHKLSYVPVMIRPGVPAVAAAVAAGSGNVRVKVSGNDVDMQITVTTGGPVNGEIVHATFGKPRQEAPVGVVSSGDAFTAGNASKLYCQADGGNGFRIGGELAAAGTYTFNVHMGQ